MYLSRKHRWLMIFKRRLFYPHFVSNSWLPPSLVCLLSVEGETHFSRLYSQAPVILEVMEVWVRQMRLFQHQEVEEARIGSYLFVVLRCWEL